MVDDDVADSLAVNHQLHGSRLSSDCICHCHSRKYGAHQIRCRMTASVDVGVIVCIANQCFWQK